jgi:hypothetical protein
MRVGALGGEVREGEEEHQCQPAGSELQSMITYRKHPTTLLRIEVTAWNPVAPAPATGAFKSRSMRSAAPLTTSWASAAGPSARQHTYQDK